MCESKTFERVILIPLLKNAHIDFFFYDQHIIKVYIWATFIIELIIIL